MKSNSIPGEHSPTLCQRANTHHQRVPGNQHTLNMSKIFELLGHNTRKHVVGNPPLALGGTSFLLCFVIADTGFSQLEHVLRYL